MIHCSSGCCIRLILSIALLIPITVHATESPASAKGPRSLLTLHWRDAQGYPKQTKLNLEQLDALPQLECTQTLPATLGIPGRHAWQGISLRELLKISGNTGQSLRLIALNGYFTSVPISDIEQFDPILAYRRDGQNLKILNKGPFILVYPFNTFSELNQQIYINRSVWQIHEIYIE